MSKTAACLHTYPLMLMVLLIIIFAASAKGMPSAINLDVSHTQSGLMVVSCDVDANLTNMVTVASMTLFGSKPYEHQYEFDELAVVDIWSNTPKLTSDQAEDADTVINGKTGPENDGHSYLAMSWNSPTPGYRQYYKCVANGLDHQRQAASISTTVKVGISNGGCCEKMDSIASKIEALDSKLETFQQNQNLQFKKVAIDRCRFDVSDISKGRVYLASKAQAAFNIRAANQACKSSGGYLVEFDDDEEYRFVYDFVTSAGGANNFFTGGNDIQREGYFVYFNSKKPVPILRGWAVRQPDNAGGSEDCIEIRLNFQGLNDWVCSQIGKFVCEVELYR
ncbi:lectin-galc1 [Plakobranchus ocellatus]|uniref:Lectin-galc1 n=1 Tax=Plakobranchus ocellatus TaxID=259542 RepID=A0AAV3ZPM1_9GAST|nr:lectin-galc1 [Plakobranchus ocellatus]